MHIAAIFAKCFAVIVERDGQFLAPECGGRKAARLGFREGDDVRRYRTLRLLRYSQLGVRCTQNLARLRRYGVRLRCLHFAILDQVQGFPESRL